MRIQASRPRAEFDDATTSLLSSLEVRRLASDSQLTLERSRKRCGHSLTKSEQIGLQDTNICLPDINKIIVYIPVASVLAKGWLILIHT